MAWEKRVFDLLQVRLVGLEAGVSWFCHHDDKEVARHWAKEVTVGPSLFFLGEKDESRVPITLITVQCILCKRYKQSKLYGHLRPVE